MSWWNSVLDLLRIARCRQLQDKGQYSEALTALADGARPSSSYSRFISLYRLWLLTLANDQQRFPFSTVLEKQDWPDCTERDRYFNVYRRYMISAIAKEWQVTREAGIELQSLPVSAFIRNTIPPPTQQFLQDLV